MYMNWWKKLLISIAFSIAIYLLIYRLGGADVGFLLYAILDQIPLSNAVADVIGWDLLFFFLLNFHMRTRVFA